MYSLSDDQKKYVDVLLKDHESLRAEIRLYIDKQYLAVIVALGVITYGVFSTNETTRGIAFIFMPYIIAALVILGYARILYKQCGGLYKAT